jgi:hypothetical protein
MGACYSLKIQEEKIKKKIEDLVDEKLKKKQMRNLIIIIPHYDPKNQTPSHSDNFSQSNGKSQ